MKKNIFFTILFTVVLSCLLFLIGYQIGINEVPKNCAELGALHLKLGKEELKITDFESEQWEDLIDYETEITNKCYESFGQKNLL